MANISKGWGIGDTVWVAYPFPSSNYFTPQSRVVKDVRNYEADNDSSVTFIEGLEVFDGTGVLQAVFTTEALAATQIIDNVIIAADAAANLDATTSLGSTVSQPTLSLGRVDA